MSGARPLLPLYAFMMWRGIKLPSIKHTWYEHCHYETVNTINWTTQSLEYCVRKDNTGQNNLRKQSQLFVNISKQFNSDRIWWWTVKSCYYFGHCPNTIFRAKDLLPSTYRSSVSTIFFSETGDETCSYWQVQCRTKRLNPRWQLAIVFEPLYFDENWRASEVLNASQCYSRLRYEIIVNSSVPDGPSFLSVYRRID